MSYSVKLSDRLPEKVPSQQDPEVYEERSFRSAASELEKRLRAKKAAVKPTKKD